MGGNDLSVQGAGGGTPKAGPQSQTGQQMQQAVESSLARANDAVKALGYDGLKLRINAANETSYAVEMTFIKAGKEIETGDPISLTADRDALVDPAGVSKAFGNLLVAAVKDKHARYGVKPGHTSEDVVITAAQSPSRQAQTSSAGEAMQAPTTVMPKKGRDTSFIDKRWVRLNMELNAEMGVVIETAGKSEAAIQKAHGDSIESLQNDLSATGLYTLDIDRKGGDGTKAGIGAFKSMTGASTGEARALLAFAAKNADAFKAAAEDPAKMKALVSSFREPQKPVAAEPQVVQTQDEVRKIPKDDGQIPAGPPAPSAQQLESLEKYAVQFGKDDWPLGTGVAFAKQLGILEQAKAQAPDKAELYQGLIDGMKGAAAKKIAKMAQDEKEKAANTFLMSLENPALAGELTARALNSELKKDKLLRDHHDSNDFLRALDASFSTSPDFAAGFVAGAGENMASVLYTALPPDRYLDQRQLANLGTAILNNPKIELAPKERDALVSRTIETLNDLGAADAMARIKGLNNPALGVELAMQITTQSTAERLQVFSFLGGVPADLHTADVSKKMVSLLSTTATNGDEAEAAAALIALAKDNPALAGQLTQSLMASFGEKSEESSHNDDILCAVIGKLGDNEAYITALANAEVPKGPTALERIDIALLDGVVTEDDRTAYLKFMKTAYATGDGALRAQIEGRLAHQLEDGVGWRSQDDFALGIMKAFGDDALPILARNDTLSKAVRTALKTDGLDKNEAPIVHQLGFIDFAKKEWDTLGQSPANLMSDYARPETAARVAVERAGLVELLGIAADSLPEEAKRTQFRETLGLPKAEPKAEREPAAPEFVRNVTGAALGDRFNEVVREFPSTVFVDPGTGMVVIEKDSFSAGLDDSNERYLGNRFFFGNVGGGAAHQLDNTGFGGTTGGGGIEYNASFAGNVAVLRNNDSMRLRQEDGAEITLQRVSPERAEELLGKMQFTALPPVQRPEYLATLPDHAAWPAGSHFYVDSPKHDYDYAGFRAFVGTPGNMQQLEIQNVTRRRDGGSTWIATNLGTFFFPTAFERGAKPTFTPNGSEDSVEIGKLPTAENAELIQSFGIAAGEDDIKLPTIPKADARH